MVIISLLLIILLNIIAGIMQKDDICNDEGCQPAPGSLDTSQSFIIITRIIPGLLTMGCILIAGITSIVSIIRYKDYAILLFISALIGILGIVFVIGEFAFPH